jgi:hypothetical protein
MKHAGLLPPIDDLFLTVANGEVAVLLMSHSNFCSCKMAPVKYGIGLSRVGAVALYTVLYGQCSPSIGNVQM